MTWLHWLNQAPTGRSGTTDKGNEARLAAVSIVSLIFAGDAAGSTAALIPVEPDVHILLVPVDEMNLARVEYYFSEFLSRLGVRPRWEEKRTAAAAARRACRSTCAAKGADTVGESAEPPQRDSVRDAARLRRDGRARSQRHYNRNRLPQRSGLARVERAAAAAHIGRGAINRTTQPFDTLISK